MLSYMQMLAVTQNKFYFVWCLLFGQPYERGADSVPSEYLWRFNRCSHVQCFFGH